MSTDEKKTEELLVVVRLFEALGVPLRKFWTAERPDVWFDTEGQRTGVEVSIFHADDSAMPKRGGSKLRKEEAIKAKAGSYLQFVEDMDPNNALVATIMRKVDAAIGWQHEQGSELWLAIAAGLDHDGGRLAATYVEPDRIDAKKLNDATHKALKDSLFRRAFFDVHSRGRLFEWTSETGWHERESRRPPRGAWVRL